MLCCTPRCWGQCQASRWQSNQAAAEPDSSSTTPKPHPVAPLRALTRAKGLPQELQMLVNGGRHILEEVCKCAKVVSLGTPVACRGRGCVSASGWQAEGGCYGDHAGSGKTQRARRGP